MSNVYSHYIDRRVLKSRLKEYFISERIAITNNLTSQFGPISGNDYHASHNVMYQVMSIGLSNLNKCHTKQRRNRGQIANVITIN